MEKLLQICCNSASRCRKRRENKALCYCLTTVSAGGLEPPTLCLKGRCSTPELRAQMHCRFRSGHATVIIFSPGSTQPLILAFLVHRTEALMRKTSQSRKKHCEISNLIKCQGNVNPIVPPRLTSPRRSGSDAGTWKNPPASQCNPMLRSATRPSPIPRNHDP